MYAEDDRRESLSSRDLPSSSADSELRDQVLWIICAMAPYPPEGACFSSQHLVDDLGYDSLRLMELAIALEEHFGVRTMDGEATDISRLDSAGGVAAVVIENMAKSKT
jgi:acyl carrier protein